MFDSWHLVMGPFGIRVGIGIKCLKLDLIAKTLSLLAHIRLKEMLSVIVIDIIYNV